MAQVAEAEDDDEPNGDMFDRRARKASHEDEASLSEGKNDVSCFLELLNSNNSNDESAQLFGNRLFEQENSSYTCTETTALNRDKYPFLGLTQPDLEQHDPSQCMAVGPEDETLNLARAISIELASTFEQYYNTKDQQVLDLFSQDAAFSILVQNQENN